MGREQSFCIFLKVAEEDTCHCYFTPPAHVRSKVGHTPHGTKDDCLSVTYEGALCDGKGSPSLKNQPSN